MKTKKKILFLVTQSEFGGAQRFIYRLITNLDLSKYGISVAAGPEGNNADGLLFSLQNKNFKVLPLRFLKRAVNPIVDFRAFFEIKKLLNKEKPDILFLCSSKAGFLGSWAGRNKIEKIIYRIGGWTFNDPWPKWKKSLYLWLERKTAAHKDFIINNSESDRQQAIRLGIRPKKEILTIYNGLDTEKLSFLTKEKAREFLKAGQEFLVGTVANFYPPKNLQILVEAANRLKDFGVKFIIIGDGEERGKIEELIEKYNLNNIFLPGAIPDSWKYLKAFDIFVLPSIKEGFPWTIIEAMAAEIPVVATKVGAIPEIIEENKGGILIELNDLKALVETIKKLAQDKNLREKIIKDSRKIVDGKFNLKKMVNEIEKLFEP